LVKQGAHTDGGREVTVGIHGATVGIDKECFRELAFVCEGGVSVGVSRILVWPEPFVAAALLSAFIRKLGAYVDRVFCVS
jgi:hypothetical protein